MDRVKDSPLHAALLRWLEHSGTTLHPALGLQTFPGEGMGAVALRDIPADTTLFSLPRTLTFSTRTAPLHPLLTGEERDSLGEGWAALILAMMWEHQRGDKSPWQAYFATLPREFDSLIFWSDGELAELRGSTVLDKIGKADAERDYHKRVQPLVQKRSDLFGDPAPYTLDLYHRMGSCILSRSFTVLPPGSTADDSDDEEQEDVGDVAMVPMADALNAKSGCDNARLYYESATTLDMRTTRLVKAGEELYNTYADPPNADLLRRYGHVDASNPYDVVELNADLLADLACDGDDNLKPLIPAKAEWALEHEIDDSFALSYDDPLPDELIAAAHLFRLDAMAFVQMQRKKKLRAPRPGDDAALADILRRTLTAREALYATTMEDDDALLADSSLPLRKRMAIVVRRGEKAVLRAAMTALDEACAAAPPPTKRARKV